MLYNAMNLTNPDEEARNASVAVLETVLQSNRRSEALIADFSSGFARGWAWAVKKDFSTALDINFASRVVKGKKVAPVLTSGNLFNFSKGDVLYDTPLAYSQTWSESLSYLTRSLEVLSATSAEIGFEGHVEAQLHEKKEGRLVKTSVFRGTQKQFVEGLIRGF
jgi:hypothetical protein